VLAHQGAHSLASRLEHLDEDEAELEAEARVLLQGVLESERSELPDLRLYLDELARELLVSALSPRRCSSRWCPVRRRSAWRRAQTLRCDGRLSVQLIVATIEQVVEESRGRHAVC
jgi:hypothetical protein